MIPNAFFLLASQSHVLAVTFFFPPFYTWDGKETGLGDGNLTVWLCMLAWHKFQVCVWNPAAEMLIILRVCVCVFRLIADFSRKGLGTLIP